MKISYAQVQPKFLDVRANLSSAEKWIRRCQTDLLVLPEFFNTGYNFKTKREVASVAETVSEGPTIKCLQALAKELNMAIVAGFVERSGKQMYNSAAFVTPKTVGVYRKMHLFAKEKIFFKPGNLGFRVFPWKNTKVGVMICFDWFFPEPAKALALKGADVIAHPSNLVLPYCPEAMKTRCLENHVFAVTANRIGTERNLTFIGQSQIVDPWGKVLNRASGEREEIFSVEINPKESQNKKITRWNHLFRDRRIH